MWALGPLALLAFAAVSGCAREATPEVPESPPPRAASVPPGAYVPVQGGGYALPVDGPWKIHRTHYKNRGDQAFAVDLVVVENGKVKRGPGRQNADFFAYGRPVRADAPGIVVRVVDGVPDNPPGRVNKYDAHGNYVVLDHQNGEFSLFAHLVPGSIRVRPGQRVERGADLGACGNSGRSTMPHLHWQVMSSPEASEAVGIAPRYLPYLRNGERTTELPEGGDLVENE